MHETPADPALSRNFAQPTDDASTGREPMLPGKRKDLHWLFHGDWRNGLSEKEIAAVEQLPVDRWVWVDYWLWLDNHGQAIMFLNVFKGDLSLSGGLTVAESRAVWLKAGLCAGVWALRPKEPLTGRALHGRFFEALRTGTPELADAEHAATVHRFTLAVLEDRLRDFTLVRVTFGGLAYDRAILELDVFFREHHGSQGLLGAYSGYHWCGMSRDHLADWAELAARHAPTEQLTLEFGSPTAFRVGDAFTAEPRAELIVGSWLRSWQHLAAEKMPDAVAAELREGLRAEPVTLRTVETALTGYGPPHPAMLGTLRLIAPRPLSPLGQTWLAVLAEHAFYAGTGAKTTMGLGATRRLANS